MKLKLTFFTLLFCVTVYAQRAPKGEQVRRNSGSALLFHLDYGQHFAGGDLKNRFNGNLSVELGAEYMTEKQNFIFGVNTSLQFGNSVLEDPLEPLRERTTSDEFEGFILADDYGPAYIELRQRGLHSSLYVGKLFGLSSLNPRSGIRVTVGGGLLQHKIRIQEDPQAFVPQIAGDYKKGYDRLTNGFALSQFIGYQHLARNGRINFIIGVEAIQGFTQNRRDLNYDTITTDVESRFDVLYGFKVGWTLPLYIGANADEIYY